MRRTVLILLAAVFSTAAVACGGDEAESSSSPPETAGAQADGAPGGSQSDPRPDVEPSNDEAGRDREGGTDGAGDGDPERGSPRPEEKSKGDGKSPQSIEGAILGFLTSSDPEVVCRQTPTDRLIGEAYGELQGCLDSQSSDSVARSAQIERADEAGDGATAVVVPRGGPNDGERLKITLVRVGRDWRIDKLRSDVPVGP
jgi:hypothetical protein